MFLVVCVFVAVSLISGLSGQQLLDGPCSRFQVSAVPIYPINLYGNWFLFATFDEKLPLREYDCIIFFHKRGDDKNTIKTTETAKKLATNERITNNSRLTFKTPGIGDYTYQIGDVSQDAQIVATDYSSFYIDFVCADQGTKANCYVGVFTKSRNPSRFTKAKIDAFFAENQIDKTNLRYVKQNSKCRPQ